MKRYCITDSLRVVAKAAGMGVEMIQIRAKTLSAHDLFEFSRQAVKLAGESKVLVNTRFDIAFAAGAHGVHLPSRSVEAYLLRRLAPARFLIGVSCHEVEEVWKAQQGGADFVVFGPVFRTSSKPDAAPMGIDTLRRACATASIPVYALGGVTEANGPACIEAGAAGVAGISLFGT